MPIYVGKNPSDADAAAYEAHHLLGHDIVEGEPATPVNVETTTTAGAFSSPAIYRVPGLSDANADLVNIYVVTPEGVAYNIENHKTQDTEQGYPEPPRRQLSDDGEWAWPR